MSARVGNTVATSSSLTSINRPLRSAINTFIICNSRLIARYLQGMNGIMSVHISLVLFLRSLSTAFFLLLYIIPPTSPFRLTIHTFLFLSLFPSSPLSMRSVTRTSEAKKILVVRMCVCNREFFFYSDVEVEVWKCAIRIYDACRAYTFLKMRIEKNIFQF